jgi:hypothetical protein
MAENGRSEQLNNDELLRPEPQEPTETLPAETEVENLEVSEMPDQIEDDLVTTKENLAKIEENDRETLAFKIEKLHQEVDGDFIKEKRKSSVTRIVGKDFVIDKDEIMANVERNFSEQTFQNQDRREVERFGSMKEKEKTEEEIKIIAMVNDVTNELLNKYGLDSFDIPPENIHIMKRNIILKAQEFIANAGKQGDFKQSSEAGEIIDPVSKTDLAFIALHEMIHFKSYNAMQKEISDEGWLQAYRIGLEVHSRDGKNTYFKTLNEAITEELAIRNLPKILGNPIFQKEKEKTNKLKNNPVLKSLGLVNKDTYYAGYTAMADFHYKKERELLNDTIDAFFEQNKEKFKDREEVFEVFAKAAITGNILPLGRLFDETFGKGSFRRYGNY